MRNELSTLLCLFGVSQNLAGAGTASEVFERVSPSVALITTQDEKGYPLALGSGFVVAKDTVASNFHVIRGSAAAKVKLLGKNRTYKVEGILASHPERDVVLLEVVGLEGKPLNLASGAPIPVGATIYAVGNPKGLEGTISSGIISGRRSVEGGTVLQISAPISPGSSGGPVVDDLSTVVGVATATFKGGEALNFAVPADPITLDQNGCMYVPHVVGIQAKQTLKVVTSDNTTHNIHPMPKVNQEWNISQPPGADALTKTFSRPEVSIPVKCNQHPWMRAYIHVISHPFFAVSSDDGTFTLKGVPPGKYTIEAVQEQIGAMTGEITVTAKQPATLDFKFKAQQAYQPSSLQTLPAMALE